jgi:demethylmenaquinone methyltransferase/2-methoxy-6-polyprenyl-1,4-benzoquinol methylase
VFDVVTFIYLLRYVDDPATTIAELARVLRPGGTMASLEFHVPRRAGWRALWFAYTRLVLPAAGYLTGGASWARVGSFLGPSISEHYRRHPLAQTTQAWRDAGLVDVGAHLLSLGGGVVMWGRRPGAPQ